MLARSRHSFRARGFTLIELMATIAILAILAALAGPNFSLMVMNNRVRTGAEGILTGLQLARTEAIHRNMNVSFTLDSGTGWTVATISPVTTIQTRPASEAGGNLQVTTLNGQTSLTFTSLGAVSNYDIGTSLTRVTIAPPSGAQGDSMRIDISASGQIRMCNPAITTPNDPRTC